MVDGKPNDPAWKNAAVVEFQFPWDFQTGAKQKTTARILWDDDNLYIVYDCEDSDVVAHYDKRDDPTYKDDAVEIFIYPGKNRNLYYGLEMNARGTLYDYFYIFPQLLMKRLDLVGVQLATNIRGSEIVFQSLPNPSAKFQDNSVLALAAGTLRASAARAGRNTVATAIG